MSIYLVKNNNIWHKLSLVIILVGLNGCSGWNDGFIMPQTLPEPEHKQVEQSDLEAASESAQEPDTVLSLPAIQANPRSQGTVVSEIDLDLPDTPLQLNADGTPLNRFIHLALGDILGLSFEVSSAVASRTDPVTLRITTPVSAERLLGLVQQALTAFDVSIVQRSSGLAVVSTSEAGGLPPEIISPQFRALARLGRVMEAIPLEYAEPGEAVSFARHFLQIGTMADVIVNQRLKSLLVIGDQQRVAQFKRAIDIIDRPALEGSQIRLLRPIYWNAKELAEVMRQTLVAQGARVAAQGLVSDASELQLIEVAPLNGIILTSPYPSWLNTALELFKALDVPSAHGSEVRPYIYFVKNSRAKEMGRVVANVLARTSSNSGAEERRQIGAATTPSSSNAINNELSDDEDSSVTNSAKVITDEQRNALIFVGSAIEYSELLPLIKALDTRPRQVLIEATVAEVRLDSSNKLGVEWQIENASKINGDLQGSLSTIGGLGDIAGGLTYRLVDQAGDVRARLSALVREDNARILSSPRLLAMDNEEARIQVGDQVVLVANEIADTSGSTGDSTSLVRTYNYVDTGVILEVTPTINEGGVIQLKLRQEVSSINPASDPAAPAIKKREVQTTLVANSGQSVLIGGLISHNEGIVEDKVPLLGDIPLLGAAFRNRTQTDVSTELIILITPHIISGADDADFFREAFENLVGEGKKSK